MLNQLIIHQQILFDLTAVYLGPLKGIHERLAYLAGLRNANTGFYTHETLSLKYPSDRVSEALEQCHEEIFERLLETPLAVLGKDLRNYFESRFGPERLQMQACQQLTESWIPPQAPDYLKDLYRSNQNALCALLQENRPKVR
jgi:hypothetical protein